MRNFKKIYKFLLIYLLIFSQNCIVKDLLTGRSVVISVASSVVIAFAEMVRKKIYILFIYLFLKYWQEKKMIVNTDKWMLIEQLSVWYNNQPHTAEI